MSNVLILYEAVEPCNIEITRMFWLLEQKEIVSLRSKTVSKITAEDIRWCDVVVSVRSTSNFEVQLAKYARKLSKYWVLMLDDDFIGLSEHYGKDSEGYWSARRNSLQKLTRNVDCLLAVNELLAEKYVEIGDIPKYAITHTIIEDNELSKPIQAAKRDSDKVKIALYVNDGTLEMFNRILMPVIPFLCEKYPNKLALYFMALKPDLSEYKDKLEINYVPHMPYYEFKKYMADGHFDIGLAPLEDGGFSTYKYFNKYVEYTVAGIPGIYSGCRLYRQVIEDGYNGMLCENTSEAWLGALSRFIDNQEFRLQCANNAQQHIYENFSTDSVLEKLLADIPELHEYQAPKCSLSKVKFMLFIIKAAYVWFRVRGWWHMFLVYARAGKFSAMIARFHRKILGKEVP